MRFTKEQLKEQILVAPALEMEPHLRKGQLVVIDKSLDLAQVAFEMQNDDRKKIEKYLSDGQLVKADEALFQDWIATKRFFEFIVVSPFIVARVFVDLKKDN